MKMFSLGLTALALTLSTPIVGQDTPAAQPSPGQIVQSAGPEDWVAIRPEDLLVMTLASDSEGNAREVIIQLMPAPFSQGWIENIRTLARTGWYDATSVNRVQDNYVVQWGDPNYDNPEATGEAKPLPEGLNVMGEDEYVINSLAPISESILLAFDRNAAANANDGPDETSVYLQDAYQVTPMHHQGWRITLGYEGKMATHAAPVHCYGMVGVGRNYSPDTGSGAELYTVIGHAPRHLDRNIALVGRIISGMEHLSSLPRGKGEAGFYAEEESDKRTPILSVRVAADLPEDVQPAFEYLSTDSETFAKYAETRANRRDPFFIVPAGGADICNIPVPIRRIENDG